MFNRDMTDQEKMDEHDHMEKCLAEQAQAERYGKAQDLWVCRQEARKVKAEGMAKGDPESDYWVGGKQFVEWVREEYAEGCEDPYAEHNSNYISDIMSGLRR